MYHAHVGATMILIRRALCTIVRKHILCLHVDWSLYIFFFNVLYQVKIKLLEKGSLNICLLQCFGMHLEMSLKCERPKVGYL